MDDPGLRPGLPLGQHLRLPEVDRQRTSDDVTPQCLWDFPPQGVLSPAISGEESERVLRDWRVWGALQSRGVTGGGEGVVEATPRVPARSQTVSGVLIQNPAWFCGKMHGVFSADVYRNSTVYRGSG